MSAADHRAPARAPHDRRRHPPQRTAHARARRPPRAVGGSPYGDPVPVSDSLQVQERKLGGRTRSRSDGLLRAAHCGHGGVMAKIVDRVVVFTQENHTTDNYFAPLRAWGANVATRWPTQPNPPAHDQAHTRAAYAKWLHVQTNSTLTSAAHIGTATPRSAKLCSTRSACRHWACPASTMPRPSPTSWTPKRRRR